MITTIPDRERDLQAQVYALTEELASVEASNRIRGDELVRLRDEMSKMQQHAAPPADIISRAVANAKYWMDRAEHAEAELERLRAVEPVVWKHDCAGLCTNDVELWIDACPHCGKPRAAPPAQPAEPVQRLSDERDAFEAWMSEDGQFPKAIERDRNGNYLLSTAANAWRVWQAAIESALQTKATK